MKKVICGLLIFNGVVRILDEISNRICLKAGITDPEEEIAGIEIAPGFYVEWGPYAIIHKLYRACKELF